MDAPRITLNGKEIKIMGVKNEREKQSIDPVLGRYVSDATQSDHRILKFPGARERKTKEICSEKKETNELLVAYSVYLINTGCEISLPMLDVDPVFIKNIIEKLQE